MYSYSYDEKTAHRRSRGRWGMGPQTACAYYVL
jgi:hypothetical protein